MTTSLLDWVAASLAGGQPAWQAGPRLSRVWGALAGTTALMGAIGGAGWLRAGAEVERLRAELEGERASLAARATPPRLAASAPPDFTRRLPRSPDAQSLVAELQRSCVDAGVTLSGVQLQQRAATADVLARADLGLTLRGNYPAIKQVLAEALARHANATVRRLSLRGNPASTAAPDVEATVVLGLWGAPSDRDAADAAPGGTR